MADPTPPLNPDLQGHPEQPNVATALTALRGVCAYFKVLGTYPVDVH